MRTLLIGLVSLGMLVGVAHSAVIVMDTTQNGPQPSGYSESGWAGSSGSSTAPGLGANGSRYSSAGTYFGPTRYAQFTYNPAQTGYWHIDLAWPSTAGEKNTAVNLYTGAAVGSTTDQWGNTNAPNGIIVAGTMDMYYRATSTWNRFTTAKLTAGTDYKVGIYAGYKAPGADGVASNRVAIDGVQFESATPGAPVLAGPADGATDVEVDAILNWVGGQYNSFFDVYVEANNPNPGIVLGSNLVEGSTFLDPGDLLPGTTYYWKVVAKNVDLSTSSAIWSFTTVPDPATIALLGMGGLMFIRRRRA